MCRENQILFKLMRLPISEFNQVQRDHECGSHDQEKFFSISFSSVRIQKIKFEK